MNETLKNTGKAAKKSGLWIVRPGFSDNAFSPTNERIYQQRLLMRLGERIEFAYEMEKKLAAEKEEVIKSTEGLSDEQSFDVWARKFGHTDATLAIAERKLQIRRYFYFAFFLLAMYGVFFSFNTNGFVAIVSGLSALMLAFLGLVSGLKESWRYYQVKRRSLFRFIEMWENPMRFLW